jgi:ADP-ribose pyrophosphatase
MRVMVSGGKPAGAGQAHTYRVAASDEAYRGRILAVRVDDVEMPGGRVASREVVEHFGAVAIAAVDEANRVVLIRQYRHPLGRRIRELPAGLLDAAGESALDAARRELAEEAGRGARDWSVLADVATSPGMTDEATRVFLARVLHHETRPGGADDEESESVIEEVPLSDALSAVHRGEIVNAATIAGLFAADAVMAGRGNVRGVEAPWSDRPTAFAARVR